VQPQHAKTGSELGEGRQTKEKVRAGSKEKEASNEKEEEKKEVGVLLLSLLALRAQKHKY
jgi:hypothetical protein